MIVELDLIPVPADTSLFDEDTQYLTLDSDGKYHIATWDGEQLLLDGAEINTSDDAEEAEDVDVVLIGVLPEIDLPTTI